MTVSVRKARDWWLRTRPFNPLGGCDKAGNKQSRGIRQEALFSKEVDMVIHVIVSMSSCPRELEPARVGAYSMEEGLEKGLV